MAWQAFLDESEDGRFLTIAGYISSSERWAAFSKDWEELLPTAYVDRNGKRSFKMSWMIRSPERMSRVLPFFRTIERHVAAGIATTLDLEEYRLACDNAVIWDNARRRWHNDRPAFLSNPYVFLNIELLFMLPTFRNRHKGFDNLIPKNEKIYFYFDERSDKHSVTISYDAIIRYPEFSRYFSSTPKFASDDRLLPLQAADFIAYWWREAQSGAEMPWELKKDIPTFVLQDRRSRDIIGSMQIILQLYTDRRLSIFDKTEHDFNGL